MSEDASNADDPWGGNPPPLSLKNFGVLFGMFIVVMGLMALVVHPWATEVDQAMRRDKNARAKEAAGRIAVPGSEPVWQRPVVLDLRDGDGSELASKARCLGDGARLALVPGGVFCMGRSGGPALESAHEVELDAYAIYERPVSVECYARFLAATAPSGAGDPHRHLGEPSGKSRVPDEWELQAKGAPDVAVGGVDWFDAYAYASWVGLRLPTEAEWDRARGGACLVSTDRWEWCYDGFDAGYYARSLRKNPMGPSVAIDRVVRRWGSNQDAGSSSRSRRTPGLRASDLGFRCAGTYAR